jgi:sulfur carrier protein ThiS
LDAKPLNIKVRPVGVVKMFIKDLDVELPGGTTVEQLIKSLALPDGLNIFASINGRKEPLKRILNDGDEVKLISILSGG